MPRTREFTDALCATSSLAPAGTRHSFAVFPGHPNAFMPSSSISWQGVAIRLVVALVLVFATWNLEGWSYYHWAIQPLFGGVESFTAVKFLVGTLLVAGWVVFLQAARRSIGILGAILVAAICGGVIWLLISSDLVSATSGRGISRVILIALAVVLAVGMSWSHLSQRITGQTDTDVVD